MTETRESIMNFRLGQTVSYREGEGKVARIDGKKIRVQMNNTLMCYWTHYSELKILSPALEPALFNQGSDWSPSEIRFLSANRNLSFEELGKKLGRTPGAVRVAKNKYLKYI